MSEPPYGVAVTKEAVEQMPVQVQEAWDTFHAWWQMQYDGVHPVSRKSLTPKAAEAMMIVMEAPIPGMEGYTGADSCYMINVQKILVE